VNEVASVRAAVEAHAAQPPAPLTGALDGAVAAADYALARIGTENAALLVGALSAGWLTPAEYEVLKPLAVAVAYIGGVAYPEHRGEAFKEEETK